MSFKIDPYEIELVEGCQVHDRTAQRALYDRYKDSMYTLLFRMLSNEEEAADGLQEAFIEVFRSLASYQQKSSLGAWIKVIVVRTALRLQKRKMYFENIEDHTHEADADPIVWDENLTSHYLQEGIKKLPQGYRNVFLLVEVEGYAHKEVAELLGISAGTSKSQLYHSKKMLQKLLKEIMY
ncbi:MAG: RNA polymerase sigma factor [Bacteroidota bacterium]